MWSRNWKIHVLIVIALVSSALAIQKYRDIDALSDRLGCTATWLEKAKSMHVSQMKDPGALTAGSMRELMSSIDGAYDCATKGSVAGHGPDAARSFGQYGVLPHR
jgi:hypothetical protein